MNFLPLSRIITFSLYLYLVLHYRGQSKRKLYTSTDSVDVCLQNSYFKRRPDGAICSQELKS
ncbi:uncharacterized protein isoform X3 [Rhodnius prolixus]|uniref:uncharacterized protein isoform X3 n=1 Tax=Rhodnius prolixus TaxID=13249 RepID=UPI003D18E245